MEPHGLFPDHVGPPESPVRLPALPSPDLASLNTTGGIVVPYTDTPNPADTVCADLHLQMITKAKRYLYLTTPYLAIDETITSALCTAARSGVDVRIMTPISLIRRWSSP